MERRHRRQGLQSLLALPPKRERRPGTGQEVEAQVRGTDKVAVEAAFAEACAQAVDRAQNPGKYGDTDEW